MECFFFEGCFNFLFAKKNRGTKKKKQKKKTTKTCFLISLNMLNINMPNGLNPFEQILISNMYNLYLF